MLPNAEKPDLIVKTQAVIDQVCQVQLGSMKHAPVIETDFTGSFVMYGVPQLQHEFSKILLPHQIKTTTQAVYIHQSPMVSIDEPKPAGRSMHTNRCELGDVLLVQSHRRNPRKTYWRAVLWQLKKDTGSFQTAADPQFWLYESWPAFHVYRGGLEASPRQFQHKNSCDPRSGQFALVSNRGWNICPPAVSIGPASPGIVNAGEFIIEMMYAVDPMQSDRRNTFGRRMFTRAEPKTPLSWSRTIWDILNYTGAKNFRAKNLIHGSQSRLSLMYSSGAASASALLPPPEKIRDSVEEGRGLYVIHIGTDASDATPEDVRRPD